MNEQSRLLVVHGACVAVIALCFIAAGTILKGQSLLAGGVVGLGAWLWGKLGFKPAQIIVERIISKQLGVSLDEAKQLTTKPPPSSAIGPEVTP